MPDCFGHAGGSVTCGVRVAVFGFMAVNGYSIGLMTMSVHRRFCGCVNVIVRGALGRDYCRVVWARIRCRDVVQTAGLRTSASRSLVDALGALAIAAALPAATAATVPPTVSPAVAPSPTALVAAVASSSISACRSDTGIW